MTSTISSNSHEHTKSLTVYTLQCTGGKYYVGKTTDLVHRLEAHNLGNGSEWTKLYTPIKVVHTIFDAQFVDELTQTIKMMYQYGIDNV